VDTTTRLAVNVHVPQKGSFSGDNGPATDARLNGPIGLAADALGNLFIADGYNHRVRKVTPNGIITTVAGTGTAGFSGDGGKAADARLNGPVGLAVDSAGSLFITEWGGNRVRKVTPDGMITTVAGTGTAGFSGDGGPAISARLNGPTGGVVDSAGNLFVADFRNARVRKVEAGTGTITTVAGNGKGGYGGDGGLATETGLGDPLHLVIDPVGNLLISETSYFGGAPNSDRVLKVFGVAAPGLIAGKAFPQ
jgi:sugar lactone lactonase YvrE